MLPASWSLIHALWCAYKMHKRKCIILFLNLHLLKFDIVNRVSNITCGWSKMIDVASNMCICSIKTMLGWHNFPKTNLEEYKIQMRKQKMRSIKTMLGWHHFPKTDLEESENTNEKTKKVSTKSSRTTSKILNKS